MRAMRMRNECPFFNSDENGRENGFFHLSASMHLTYSVHDF